MKKIVAKYGYITMVMSVCLFCGCSDDDHGFSGQTGSTAVYLESVSGIKTIQVSTNGSWIVEIEEPARQWLSIEGNVSGSGDAEIDFYYTQNDGFNRQGKVLLHLVDASIADTLWFRQYGRAVVLEFHTKSLKLAAPGEDMQVEVTTNLTAAQASQISLETEYTDEVAGWITEQTLSADLKNLSFSVSSNGTGSNREAAVNMVFTDGWGERSVTSCLVAQARFGGSQQTANKTFEEIRALVSEPEGSLKITDDIAITGYVISDCANPNVAGNPNTANHTIDYEVNGRTAYIQNATGEYGFALETQNPSINILKRYGELTLWLKGLTLVKQSNPERYALKGIVNESYISVKDGTSANLVLKEMYINELSDKDLYTFVTLKECEFPIRKGSFTPVNEGYGSAYNTSRVDKYPLLVRDIRGDVTYLMTNFSCPYRRDGSALPQGAGKISAIVVHEAYDRFEKDGNIGRYQLRHLTRDDIALSQNASQGFSSILCEWSSFPSVTLPVAATNGSGELSKTTTPAVSNTVDFSCLGPITGVQAQDNKGVNAATDKQAIATTGWWNNGSESWVVKFPTQGISAGQLSMQMALFNRAIGAPRYWTVEWSTHGEKDGVWQPVQDYTLPDPVNWSSTLQQQLSGWKNINISLPQEMLDNPTVYIRLRVAQNKAGTAASYDGTTISSKAGSALSYLSIRYNN